MSAPQAIRTRNGSRTDLLAGALLALAVLLLVVVLPYAAGYGNFRRSMLSILWGSWFDPQDSTWQHGVLAPVISGWLVWRRRQAIAALPVHPSVWGLVITVVSLAAFFVGYKANNYYFGALGLQLLPVGVIAWTLGWRQFHAVLFAWSILMFAWPLRFLEDTLGFQLRLIMVKSVAGVLELMHAPILRDGTSLVSAPGNGHAAGSWLTLSIDGPCSGMRSLFALMMVSALFAWFRQRTLPRQWLLFATSIPLAIVGNMVRIFLLIGGSAVFGQSFAVGDQSTEMTTFHFLAGIAVFVVAVMGMQGFAAVMDAWLPVRRTSRARLPLGEALGSKG